MKNKNKMIKELITFVCEASKLEEHQVIITYLLFLAKGFEEQFSILDW